MAKTTRAMTDVSPELPAGWRWESYGGVEVGVPDSWVRRLTVEAGAPFLTGPNAIHGSLSSNVAAIVWADRHPDRDSR